jgi:2-polyprenyl-6-methoxyphenol hydroxylase-like FAD-dependent oxidoreductase
MRVAVVGCGTAGSAAALLLAARGHEVEVLERVVAPAPVGAGLLLQPTGMAVLGRLGLLECLLDRGTPVRRLHGETASGRVVMDLAYGDLRPGLFGLGVHRGALFAALRDALRRAGAAVRTGCEALAVEDEDDGAWLRDAAGGRHGPYALVVAADGARSALRRATGLCVSDRRYPWGALWAIRDDRDDRYAGALSQVFRGTREMIGFLPTGEGRVSLFWSVRCSEGERWPEPGLAALKRAVHALTRRADPLLDQLHDPSQVLFAPYRDVRTRGRWHAGRVVLLGDAGHATSPQLGQGANLALVDAWALARSLDEERDVGAALARYSARRRAHLRFYAIASRWLTPVYQAEHELLAWPRDRLLAPAARVGWLRRQMLATMAGAKTGPFATLPASELPGPARRPEPAQARAARS